MGIEGLNRIHWTIIGCLLGVLIASAWLMSQDTQGEGDRAAFERDVALKDPRSTNPLIKDIVIHPSEVDYQGKSKTLVSYKRLAQDKQGKLWWVDRHFIADVPYRPGAVAARAIGGAIDPNMTIESFLAELAKQPSNDFVKFSYGWWYIPSRAILAGGAGGVLLIGGLWPTLLGLMAGAGFGRKLTADDKKRLAEEKAYRKAHSLWNYKSKSRASSTGSSGKPIVTAADRQELQAVADAYEKSVGADAVESADLSIATGAKAAAQEVQQLNAGPLQQAAKQGDEDDIELKNREYYPTIVHHKKDEKKSEKDAPPKH